LPPALPTIFQINYSTSQPVTSAKRLDCFIALSLSNGLLAMPPSLSLRAEGEAISLLPAWGYSRSLLAMTDEDQILPCPPLRKEGEGLPPFAKGERGGFSCLLLFRLSFQSTIQLVNQLLLRSSLGCRLPLPQLTSQPITAAKRPAYAACHSSISANFCARSLAWLSRVS
jgi:hypothetical protein